jgi:hypothetical protein
MKFLLATLVIVFLGAAEQSAASCRAYCAQGAISKTPSPQGDRGFQLRMDERGQPSRPIQITGVSHQALLQQCPGGVLLKAFQRPSFSTGFIRDVIPFDPTTCGPVDPRQQQQPQQNPRLPPRLPGAGLPQRADLPQAPGPSQQPDFETDDGDAGGGQR